MLHFRRSLTSASVPASYPVRVSADNRFILYVNGQRVGDGPARGDLAHWRYERFDLAPLLHAGQNLITATVWNWGVYAPVAQMSDRTAFLLESEATGRNAISTPEGWQVEIEPGHRRPRSQLRGPARPISPPAPARRSTRRSTTGTGNRSQTPPAPHGFPSATPMRDSIFPGVNKAHSADTTGDNFWGLVPDALPHMEYSPTSAGETGSRRLLLAEQPACSIPCGSPARIPPQSHVHILLDRKTLTTAYPSLTVSGGKGAHIRLTYSEALYDKKQAQRATATMSAIATGPLGLTRQLSARRRRAPHLRAAVVAHLALSRPRYRDRDRPADAGFAHRQLHGVPV